METTLHSSQGDFQIHRLPFRKGNVLRAWDAADEYLLQEVAAIQWPDEHALLILNDSFGALAVALHPFHPVAQSDSWLSQQATLQNLQLNKLDESKVTLINSLQTPEFSPHIVLIKIPKTLALLEYQLIQLQPLINEQTVIIAGGMIKNLPTGVWKLFEKYCGEVTTSLARKKARLLFVKVNQGLKTQVNPYPVNYQLEQTDFAISNHANVFSRESLDIGTRFFLQHLPQQAYEKVIDLGCGNGVVGLMYASKHPQANIIFIDESFMAIASAQQNFEQAFNGQRQAEYVTTDCLQGIAPDSVDCVLCNPPFHQQHSIGDTIALKMFRQAKNVLRKGGELRVIGNRHLNYHQSMKKTFQRCDLIASNKKFVVLSAVTS